MDGDAVVTTVLLLGKEADNSSLSADDVAIIVDDFFFFAAAGAAAAAIANDIFFSNLPDDVAIVVDDFFFFVNAAESTTDLFFSDLEVAVVTTLGGFFARSLFRVRTCGAAAPSDSCIVPNANGGRSILCGWLPNEF